VWATVGHLWDSAILWNWLPVLLPSEVWGNVGQLKKLVLPMVGAFGVFLWGNAPSPRFAIAFTYCRAFCGYCFAYQSHTSLGFLLCPTKSLKTFDL